MARPKKEKKEKKKRKMSAYNQFVKDFSKVHGKTLGKNRMKLISKFWDKSSKTRRTGWDKPMTKEHLDRVDKDAKFDAGNFELIKMGADAKAKAREKKKSEPKPQKKNVVKMVEKKEKKVDKKIQVNHMENKIQKGSGRAFLKTMKPGHGRKFLKSLLKP